MVPKGIYLKKLAERDGYATWLVNGSRVRRDLDENFVEYDHHGRFRFIPEHEFWIDNEMPEKEYRLYIERLYTELAYIKEGMTPHEAAQKADTFEELKREQSQRVQKILESKNAEYVRAQVRRHKLAAYSSVVSVWLVDGALVRSMYMLGYTEGGHDVVYPWIPRNEIWIEESLKPEEREFIILHELHERYLMIARGMSYENAHHGATIVEDHYREHPAGLAKRIREEIAKNDQMSGPHHPWSLHRMWHGALFAFTRLFLVKD